MAVSRSMSSQHWLTDSAALSYSVGPSCRITQKNFSAIEALLEFTIEWARHTFLSYSFLSFCFLTLASFIIAIEAIMRSQYLFIVPFLFSALLLFIFRRLLKYEKVLLVWIFLETIGSMHKAAMNL